MNLIPYIVMWAALASVVAILAVYRKMVAGKIDETLHLAGGAAPVASDNSAMLKELETIEKWGKILTVLTFIAGLAIVGIYIYRAWMETAGLPV